MRRFIVGCLAASIALAARDGNAGQSFVSVGSLGNVFTPPNGFVRDQGDVVVWRFAGSGHTVTEGTSGSGVSLVFNTNPAGGSQFAGSFFSWKTDRPTVSYYCTPHFPFNMKGSITVVGSTQQEADFRINEVRYDGVGSNFVEITNLGDGAGDLQGFRLAINGVASTPWAASTPVLPGGFVVVNNPSGLTSTGSVALYAPHTIAGTVGSSNLLTDATMMLDYVEWGLTGGQALESVAILTVVPKVWSLGDFAAQVAQGHDISFCGVRFQHGVTFWTPTANPTPGASNNCASPAVPSTWGRLKFLYR